MSHLVFKKTTCNEVTIISSDEQTARVLCDALAFLRSSDKNLFRKVVKWIRTILVSSPTGYLNGVYEHDRVWVAEGQLITETTPEYIASLLLHESHHVAQYHSGYSYELPRSEQKAYEVQRRFLKQINYQEAIETIDEQYRNEWWKGVTKNTDAISRLDRVLERYKAGKLRIHDEETTPKR